MDTTVDKTIDTPEATQVERAEMQVVKSMYIAGELCSYAPYFKDLIAIRKDKFKENRRVWVFRRSEEFDKDFALLVEESKKRRENKENANV